MDFVDFFRARVPTLHEQKIAALRRLCEERGIISAKDCEALGIERRVLIRAAKQGYFEKVAPGWYRSRHLAPDATHSPEILQVAYRVHLALHVWGEALRRRSERSANEAAQRASGS